MKRLDRSVERPSTMKPREMLLLLVCLFGMALTQGCASVDGEGQEDEFLERAPYADEDEMESEAARESRRLAALATGKELFRDACATCHGLRGDGRGPSAEPLNPKPADFTLGVYKWRSTESGSLPLDRDIFRSISRGVPGTMMVAWEDLLSEEDRWSLVEYVKSFSIRFEEEGVEEEEIVEIPEPTPPTDEAIERGKVVYDEAKCWECHGYEGRGDGPSAPTLTDNWGRPSDAFDFTLGEYRGGGTDRDLYRVFYTGLNGTPMPEYASTIAEEDRWPLVHYTRSLERSPNLLERFLFEVPGVP